MSDDALTVIVSFDRTATPQWTFSPPQLNVNQTQREAGKKVLTIKRAPSSPWQFIPSLTTFDPNDGELTVDPSSNGNQIIVDDLDDNKTTYTYTVTVLLDGVRYTSPATPGPAADPPPQIMNDVGTGAGVHA